MQLLFVSIMKNSKKRPVGFKGTHEWMGSASILMRFGLTMVLSISAFFLLGYKLDNWLGSRGIFTVLLTIFGVIGGARYVYRNVMKIYEDEEK
jgi:hypothetical protein